MKGQDQALIDSFFRDLLARGISEKTAQRHRENLNFFLKGFLEPSERCGFLELEPEALYYFLFSYLPDKFKTSPSELLSLITSLRKFYRYLFSQRKISRNFFEEILGTLSRKEYYLSRLQNQSSEKESEPENFWIDQGLYLLVRNLSKPPLRIVVDFQLFLDYLIHHPIKLTSRSSLIPGNHLQKLNQMFSQPEALSQKASQDDSQRVSVFYQLARSLDLVVVGSYFQLLTTPRAEAFLEREEDEQLVILIDALWNRVRWSELQRFGANGFASWAQENRGGLAELLSQLPAEISSPLSIDPRYGRLSRILANFLILHEVVESKILFALREMGILDYQLRENRDPYSVKHHRGIKSITMTRFGKKIMKYLARKAQQELGGKSLIDLMEESLIYL